MQKVGAMEKIEYPKFLYKDGEAKLVQDADEHEALGADWAESPAEQAAAEKPKKGKKAE